MLLNMICLTKQGPSTCSRNLHRPLLLLNCIGVCVCVFTTDYGRRCLLSGHFCTPGSRSMFGIQTHTHTHLHARRPTTPPWWWMLSESALRCMARGERWLDTVTLHCCTALTASLQPTCITWKPSRICLAAESRSRTFHSLAFRGFQPNSIQVCSPPTDLHGGHHECAKLVCYITGASHLHLPGSRISVPLSILQGD